MAKIVYGIACSIPLWIIVLILWRDHQKHKEFLDKLNREHDEFMKTIKKASVDATAQVRITVDYETFKAMVAGHEVRFGDRVVMILKDIGFGRMEAAITEAKGLKK